MPSLKNRVAQQRDTLMARGPAIRVHAERARGRLGHPVVLIPAFMCGMLTARWAPPLLGHLREGLGSLDTILKLMAILVPDDLGSSVADSEELGAPPHRPTRLKVVP